MTWGRFPVRVWACAPRQQMSEPKTKSHGEVHPIPKQELSLHEPLRKLCENIKKEPEKYSLSFKPDKNTGHKVVKVTDTRSNELVFMTDIEDEINEIIFRLELWKKNSDRKLSKDQYGEDLFGVAQKAREMISQPEIYEFQIETDPKTNNERLSIFVKKTKELVFVNDFKYVIDMIFEGLKTD